MSLLELGLDELLSTTRAVRKRLDFTKPVPDDIVRECVAIALQANDNTVVGNTAPPTGPAIERYKAAGNKFVATNW